MKVASGDRVKAGEEIGQVRSPEQDNIAGTYMRALADIAGRRAELRIKARVAQESLEAARAYERLAEETVHQVETSSAVSLNYRIEIFRERALAHKTVVSQEAEIAEATTQLAELNEISQELHNSLDQVEHNFDEGRVLAPVGGIVSTGLAHVGQSLVAGTPFAEILDPTDVFVDWYIPNERLADPRVGQEVFVLFGNRRIHGKVAEILPVSAVYAGTQTLMARERTATQIARIRFSPGAELPPLNATVHVHMYYTALAHDVASWLVGLFGFR
jgi:multidrug resistance efflux pump